MRALEHCVAASFYLSLSPCSPRTSTASMGAFSPSTKWPAHFCVDHFGPDRHATRKRSSRNRLVDSGNWQQLRRHQRHDSRQRISIRHKSYPWRKKCRSHVEGYEHPGANHSNAFPRRPATCHYESQWRNRGSRRSLHRKLILDRSFSRGNISNLSLQCLIEGYRRNSAW